MQNVLTQYRLKNVALKYLRSDIYPNEMLLIEEPF